MALKYLSNVATLEYDTQKCTGCGRCLEVCPQAVFALDGSKAQLVDRDACMECGACAKNCAEGAITVRAGVGCAWAILRSRLKKTEAVSCG